MGSSSQRRLNGRSLALISSAWRTVHGQLTSSVISTLSPAAFRASRTASTVISWSFRWEKPSARARLTFSTRSCGSV